MIILKLLGLYFLIAFAVFSIWTIIIYIMDCYYSPYRWTEVSGKEYFVDIEYMSCFMAFLSAIWPLSILLVIFFQFKKLYYMIFYKEEW